MLEYIILFFYYLRSLFFKGKKRGKAIPREPGPLKQEHREPEQVPSKYFAPRRAPSWININTDGFPKKKIFNYSEDLSKQTRILENFENSTRSSSPIFLRKIGSEESMLYRLQETARAQESGNRLRTPKGRDMKNGDFTSKKMYKYQEDLSKQGRISRPNIPLTRSFSDISLMKLRSEENFGIQEPARKLKSANRPQKSYPDFEFGPGTMSKNTSHNSPIGDISHLSADKGSKSTMDINDDGDELIQLSANTSDYFVNQKIFSYSGGSPKYPDVRNSDFPLQKVYNYPEDLSEQARISRQMIPLTRSSSHVSLRTFGSEGSISSRMQESARKLEFANKSSSSTRMNVRNDIPIKRTFSYSDDLSKQTRVTRPTIPLTRSFSHISLMKGGSEESTPFGMQESSKLKLGRRSRNGLRSSDFDFEARAMSGNAIHNRPTRDFPRLSAKKDWKTSMNHSEDGELIGTSAKPADYFFNEKILSYPRGRCLRQKPYHRPDFPVKSKIPVHNLGRSKSARRQPGQHNLPANQFYKNGNTLESGDANTSSCHRPPVVGTWIEFRMDTNKKFDCVFKLLSKQKRKTSNLIDAATHSQWVQVAGVEVDLDGKMFKQYAGGKVVLNLVDYKALIDKICSVHDLDYWDVLRRMATFQQQETNYQ